MLPECGHILELRNKARVISGTKLEFQTYIKTIKREDTSASSELGAEDIPIRDHVAILACDLERTVPDVT